MMIQFELTPIKMGRCLTVCPPKKRPRVWHKNGRSGAYHENNYVLAQQQVLTQLRSLNLTGLFPVPCQIDVDFYGDLTADCDNAIGFLYDVLVLGGYLPDDNPKCIVGGAFTVYNVLIPKKSGKGKFKKSPNLQDKLDYWGAVVTVKSCDIESIVRKPVQKRTLKKFALLP